MLNYYLPGSFQGCQNWYTFKILRKRTRNYKIKDFRLKHDRISIIIFHIKIQFSEH